jgi:hypothetical protein
MDLLSSLTYTTFDNFYIHVDKIQYGWMYLSVGTDDRNFNYAASYLGDPLNELLHATISIVKEQKSNLHSNAVTNIRDYVYVIHELEPDLVTWLFKYNNDELTLIIWKNIPTDVDTFDMLIEEDFNSQSVEITLLDKASVLTDELAFAIKGNFISFIKALINTFINLGSLKRHDGDSNDADWGFSYSIDNFNFLKEWLLKNDPSIN